MNKGLHLIRSNQLESLANQFVAELLQSTEDSFKRRDIITQTPAIGRWLQLKIADKMGISAHLNMVRPESFLREKLLDKSEHSADDSTLTWQLFHLLKTLPNEAPFSAVRSFVTQGDLMRFQLAQKVAELFDQYVVFRPQMIDAWNQKRLHTKQNDEVWQSFLWNKLKESNIVTRDTLLHTMMQRAETKSLTQPVYLFGISAMAHYQLDMFNALANKNAVLLYHLTPSKEYFGDIRKKEVVQLELIEQLTPDKQPLLSELGSLSKHFIDWVEQCDTASETTLFSSQEKTKPSLLHRLQSDMLHLTPPAPFSIQPDDHSITIASTPSSYRECEILQNTLFDALEQDATLEPRDIVVMTPNIKEYAPYIDAVFGYTDSKQFIPYSIAGGTPSNERGITAALRIILSFKGSKLTAEEIITLFRSEAISQQFGIESQSDVNMLEKWIIKTGIDWGIDTDHRKRLGFPSKITNSWQFGRERLILGMAMTESKKEPFFHNISPFEGVKGKQAVMLGNFLHFLDTLFLYVRQFDEKKTLDEWAELSEDILETLFSPSVEKEHLQLAFAKETTLFRTHSTDESVSFDMVRYILINLLDTRSSFRRLISGGISFCDMKSLRAIPFKMGALIGMNEGSFPRSDNRVSYDLIGQTIRSDDRSIRENDRHLFLELLLSARNRIHISYTGINHHSGEKLFPSVIVSRLRTIIKTLYETDILFNEHPIHSFSQKYFSQATDITSYSSTDEKCAQQFSQQSAPHTTNRFTVQPIAYQENNITLNISQLAQFFSNPPYYFAKQVLKLRLLDKPEERESGVTQFGFNHLEKWNILNELLSRYETSESISLTDTFYFRELAGQGKLPWGRIGKLLFQSIALDAQNLFRRSASLRNGEQPHNIFVDYHYEDTHSLSLFAHFGGIYPNARIIHNPSKKLNTGKQITYLLHHLLMQTDTPHNLRIFHGTARTPFSLYSKDTSKAEETLNKLIWYFFEGLTRPLPFLPDISTHIYSAIKKGEKNPETALKSALKFHYEHLSRFPKTGDAFALSLSGLEQKNEAMAIEACDLSTLIFETLETMNRE